MMLIIQVDFIHTPYHHSLPPHTLHHPIPILQVPTMTSRSSPAPPWRCSTMIIPVRTSAQVSCLTISAMASAVLATDMAVHKTLQNSLQTRVKLSSSFDFAVQEDRIELIKVVLHAADIFNPARPTHLSSSISLLLVDEFRLQVAKERALNLPVTAFMDMRDDLAICNSEIGFSSYVAKPFFQVIADCFPSTPAMNFIPMIDANIAHWQMRAESLSR